MSLANHAGPDGTGAFPSVATLVRYTSLSERTVRTCLDRLEAEGILAPCDPAIIAARIKRADTTIQAICRPAPAGSSPWTAGDRRGQIVRHRGRFTGTLSLRSFWVSLVAVRLLLQIDGRAACCARQT